MKKLFLLFCGIALSLCTIAQMPVPAVLDSFKRELSKAEAPARKIQLIGYMTRILMNVDLQQADMYGQQMIEIAEESRDRTLMVEALTINGDRYSYVAGRKDNIEKSIRYYNKALELARQNKLDKRIASIYLGLSRVHRFMPDLNKAIVFCNQADSYIDALDNDSLKAESSMETGTVFLQQGEKLPAMRKFLTALQIAERLKDRSLLRSAYGKLSDFYNDISEYDKAIDYKLRAMQQLSQIVSGQSVYNRVNDLNRIGSLYRTKQDYDMAMVYYEKALKLIDSLKYTPMKSMVYNSIFRMYIDNGQPAKALQYFNDHPELKNYLQTLNFGAFIDQTYGLIYTQLGRYDSAKYYYAKAAPFFEKDFNDYNRFDYNYQLGRMHRKAGETQKSIEYLMKAKEMADKIGGLYLQSSVAWELDSLYRQAGDYKNAMIYASLYNSYQDSLSKQNKEKEVVQLEVADEQQRMARESEEKAAAKRKRDSVQYLVITIGIAILFIGLVMLGMFRVSTRTIKMVGFFAFIMMFEFIFLVSKKSVYGYTQGEPWKDLLFMILLAAILLPLHHWLEHRVIKYLTSHNRLTSSGKGLVEKFKRNKPAVPAEKD